MIVIGTVLTCTHAGVAHIVIWVETFMATRALGPIGAQTSFAHFVTWFALFDSTDNGDTETCFTFDAAIGIATTVDAQRVGAWVTSVTADAHAFGTEHTFLVIHFAVETHRVIAKVTLFVGGHSHVGRTLNANRVISQTV